MRTVAVGSAVEAYVLFEFFSYCGFCRRHGHGCLSRRVVYRTVACLWPRRSVLFLFLFLFLFWCFQVCCDDGAHGAMARAGKTQLVTVRHLSSEAHSCFLKPAIATRMSTRRNMPWLY